MLETPAALMIFNPDGAVRLRNRAAGIGIEPQDRVAKLWAGSSASRAARDP